MHSHILQTDRRVIVMTKVVLNTDETKFGGQGLIKDNQYLRRTISRR